MPTPDQKPTQDQTNAETKTTASTDATPAADLNEMSSGYGSKQEGHVDAGHRYTGGDIDEAMDANTDYTDDSQRLATPLSDLNDDLEEGSAS